MRTRIVLRTVLALAATAMAGQIATGIHLQEVLFTGDTRLDGLDLKKCGSDLKSQIYEGANWTDDLVGRVQTQCLVDKGYFKAAVQASSQQLPDKNHTHQFVVTFHIDPGPRYHLGQITFKGNHAIADTKALRNLFPTTDGSILDRKAIANGLENLRYAYEELGYINFTSVPTPRIDEDKKLVYFDIDVDEGKTFYISSVDVLGADARVLNDLPLKPGQVYNVRLVDQFLRKHLPDVNVNDPRVQQRLLDERRGTVALTFDFRFRTD
jgi:outer membrane translocation and assembly module TamA